MRSRLRQTWNVQMRTLIPLGLLAVLALYYARFFVLIRQDASTIVQILLLLAAAMIVLVPVHANWKVTKQHVWLTTLIAIGVCAAILIWSDQSSHSVSDTLNRAVPGICLVLAVAIRIDRLGFDSDGLSAQDGTVT
jgi:hypothetical protein